MKKTIILIPLVFLAGCAGTIGSRSNKNGIGAYPYQAVAVDVYYLPHGIMNYPGESALGKTVGVTFGILSIPVDLAIDTILLPVDLIAWPFGCKKKNGINGFGGVW